MNKNLEEKEKRLEKDKEVYRSCGYSVEKDFPGEYYFMYNPGTGEKVRLYYWGMIDEYRNWEKQGKGIERWEEREKTK